MQPLKSEGEQRSIAIVDAKKEIEEFTRWRWYETYWDYQYRIRNIPDMFFSFAELTLSRQRSNWSEAELLELIESARREELFKVASDCLFQTSREVGTIQGTDIKFDLLKGKNYKTAWKKICMDDERFKDLPFINYSYYGDRSELRPICEN